MFFGHIKGTPGRRPFIFLTKAHEFSFFSGGVSYICEMVGRNVLREGPPTTQPSQSVSDVSDEKNSCKFFLFQRERTCVATRK